MQRTKNSAARRVSVLAFLVGLLTVFGVALPSSTGATSLSEVRKLVASDAQANDRFGSGVAVSGDTAVLGAPFESAAGHQAGAAYIFERAEGGADNWGEVKKLSPPGLQAGDLFGDGVAISGDTIIVGAEGNGPGAAYVFERDAGGAENWGLVRMLTASDGEASDRFGDSVAISGHTAVVGAPSEDSPADGAGAVYVFEQNEGGADNWGEVKKLAASDAEALDRFGGSTAVSGDTVVAGAFNEDAGGTNAGAAYIFQRDAGGVDNWGEVKKLTASDAEALDFFGAVALDGDTALVGAHANDAGAAYIFRRDAGGVDNWGEVKKLTASDAEANDHFGWTVAISDGLAVIGAAYEDTAGDQAGAAYVFERDEGSVGNWGELKKLTASDAEALDYFGGGVAITGDTVFVAASSEGAGDLNILAAGSAYVFGFAQAALPGDVSCDGAVNAIDAAFMLQFIAALFDSLPCEDAADANADGLANTLDVALILQFTAGLVDSLPP